MTGIIGPTMVTALPSVRLDLGENVQLDFMLLQCNVLVHVLIVMSHGRSGQGWGICYEV